MKARFTLAALALPLLLAPAAASERAADIRAAGWRTSVVRAEAPATMTGWATSVVRLRPTTSIVTASLPDAAGPRPLTPLTGHRLSGIASFYWQDQMTANGERFDKTALSAAHLTLPFNTRVRVTHAVTGRSVIVRINDRGPYKAGRVIDLSDAAAGVLGMRDQGLAPVQIEVLR
mgnify:CR=1 FL=1